MFRRLLIPTDGSEQLSLSMPLVRHLASRTGASITLLCVESPIVNMSNVLDNSTALDEHALRIGLMERFVEDLQREGIDAHYDVEFGRPEHHIETGAKQHDSDLIVMTPHHRAGFEAVLHPSVTARMFCSAPAPLLVVPERAATYARSGLLSEPDSAVVVPLDGSDLAERAMPFAATLAQMYSRRLQLVRVVPTPHDATAYSEAYERPDSHAQTLMQQARRYMSSLQTGIKRATGLPVDVEVTIGEPAAEIVDIAEESPTDLIVMSTHGHGTLGRLLLGSVATEVMWRSTVPVLIVPPHANVPMSDASLICTVTTE